MNVRYSSRAVIHLIAIDEYLRERNSAAATELLFRIKMSLERLRTFPELGRVNTKVGVRELVVHGTSYIVVYEIKKTYILVLGVFHGARDRP